MQFRFAKGEEAVGAPSTPRLVDRCGIHQLSTSPLDACCSQCHAFLWKESHVAPIVQPCCGQVVYCSGAKCAEEHMRECHWLMCSNASKMQVPSELKTLLKCIDAAKEASVFRFACQIVAKTISTVLVSSLNLAADASAIESLLRKQFAEITDPFPRCQIALEDCDEVVEESFTLLIAVLLNTRLPALMALLSTNETSMQIEDSNHLVSFMKAVGKVFTLEVWARILQIVDCYAIPAFLESPFLKKVRSLPSSSSTAERSRMLQLLSSRLDAAAIFLTGSSQRQESFESTEDRLLYEDRAVHLLAQAGGMANQFGDGGPSAVAEASNPFDGCGLLASVLPLSPVLLPQQLGGSIPHQCCASVGLELRPNDSVHLITLRPCDELGMDFSQSKGNTPGYVRLGSFPRLYGVEVGFPCECTLCSYHQAPESFLSTHAPTFLSSPSDSVRHLLDALRDLHQQVSLGEAPSTSQRSLRVGKADQWKTLSLVAGNEAATGQFLSAMTVYASLLGEALSSLLTARSAGDADPPVIGGQWVAESCLSLGILLFESLLRQSLSESSAGRRRMGSLRAAQSSDTLQDVSPKDMEFVYRLGLWFDPTHPQLCDLVAKMDAYRLPSSPPSPSESLSISSLADGIAITHEALLSPADCRWVIQSAESFAQRQSSADGGSGGWTTSRHYAVPTTDLPVHKLKEVCTWFRQVMANQARTVLSQVFFGSQPIDLFVNDAFIVKYQGDEEKTEEEKGENEEEGAAAPPRQRSLPLHSDQSTHSFTIALNECSEYVGGGTYFAHLRKTFRVEKGHLLCFQGSHLHGGDAVLRGTRYILAVFVVARLESSGIEHEKADLDDRAVKKSRTAGLANDLGSSGAAFSFNFF